MITDIFFYILASIAIISAILTVFSNKIFRSLMYFGLLLLCIGGLFLMMQAEFVAFMHVFIYIGTVFIMTIFVIILTSEIEKVKIESGKGWKIGSILLATTLFRLLVMSFDPINNTENGIASENDIIEVANLFFTEYAFAFELTSILLLAALIGSISIARDDDEAFFENNKS